MITVTDQILTNVVENVFKYKCIFGHEDRVAKQFFDRENNILVNDFCILFRKEIGINSDIKVGHIHGKQGFDVSKDKTKFNSLVWKYIPIIINYDLKFFLSSRFKMNDVMRMYYFWRYNPYIVIDVNELFENIDELPLETPKTFKIVVRNEEGIPLDETDYYAGDDNLIFKLNCPITVETILLSPEIQPLIKKVELTSNVYNREGNLETKETETIE